MQSRRFQLREIDCVAGRNYSNVGDALGAVADLAGNGSADAVKYDTASHNVVTLGGAGTTAVVAVHNVAPGAVSGSSHDAVNGSQLYGLASSAANVFGGGTTVNADGTLSTPSYVVDKATYNSVGDALDAVAELASASTVNAVAYDSDKHDTVTLGGTSGSPQPVRLKNVAMATDAGDAVNLAQLQAAGLDVDSQGNVTNAFVAYDDSSKASVTFGGAGAGLPPVALHNVAPGAVSSSSYDAVNGAQLYGLASSTAGALGGGSTVNANGSIGAPSYTVGGNTYNNVGAAINAVVAYAGSGSADAVIYDTSAHDTLTLGGAGSKQPVQLKNVANATDAGDAVNLAQLQAAGLDVDSQGNVTNSFVAYDDSTKTSVTFGAPNSTTPVALHNVASATQDYDAVNLSQLRQAGLDVDTSGNVTNAFVTYDDASKSTITLGGANGTVIANVKAGSVDSSSTEAVNGSQLYALEQQMNSSGLGLVMQSTDGTITVGASTNGNVVDFTGTSGTRTLTGVKGGSVNATSTDAVTGAQLYDTAQSTASALGGGATVDANGKVTAPSYSVGGTKVNNVGDAITNLDGRVTTLQSSVTNIIGATANAVQYDTAAHDQVTLGGTSATSTVKLTNLTDAELSQTSTDAVTGAQLFATNQELANLGQAVQNVGDTGSQYISTNSDSGPAAATGKRTIAIGGGSNASGDNSTAIGDQASAQGDNSVALGSNSVADRDNSVSVGSQGNERQITNVANGSAPTDAVNMRQFQSGMTSVQRGAYGGVAAATALTMIPDVDQGKTIAVGIGTANYKGYQATALGASARVTQNLKVKLGAGYSAGGGTTVGGGMSYQW